MGIFHTSEKFPVPPGVTEPEGPTIVRNCLEKERSATWHRCCPSNRVDMFRAASVLIVMALVGSPTAKLVCDVRCQTGSHSSGGADAACLDAAHHENGQAIEATRDTCARVTAVGPFLTETTYRVLPSAAGTSVVATVSSVLLDLRHDSGEFLLRGRGDSGPPPCNTVTVLRI